LFLVPSGFMTLKLFESILSTPKKLFLGDAALLEVPVKLFLGDGRLMPVKLLRAGPCELVPGKLLLVSEMEARREERGVEVEDMEERAVGRAPVGDDGREVGADGGGVDLGVLDPMEMESLSLVNIFAVLELVCIVLLVLMVGEVLTL
jgi:hypothetical protein